MYLSDLKSVLEELPSDERKKLMDLLDKQVINGWMTDHAIFAYLYEKAQDTKTRVLSPGQVSLLFTTPERSFRGLIASQMDGEPSWSQTESIIMSYNIGNHWVLLHADTKAFTIDCTICEARSWLLFLAINNNVLPFFRL